MAHTVTWRGKTGPSEFVGKPVRLRFDLVKGRPLYVIDQKVVDGVERSVLRELGEPAQADGDLRAIEAAESDPDSLASQP